VPPPHERFQFDTGLILPLLVRALKTRSFVLLIVLGGGITGTLAYLSRPIFQSEVALLYQDANGSNPVGMQRSEGFSPRRIGLTLKETLFSHTLLEKLIVEFGLYGKKVARFGVVAAADEMRNMDLHFVAHEGYTFRISYDSTSPEMAQSVTARAAELLIQAHVNSRVAEVKELERFLDGEKQRIEEELRGRESEFAMFVAKNPEVLDVGTARGGMLAMDNGGAETASLGLEMQALQLRERLSQMRQRPTSSLSSEPFRSGAPREASESRMRAEAELVAAQRELAEKQAQFTEEYPDVKRAKARVETAKARLRHTDEIAVAHPSQAPDSPPAQAQATPSPAPEQGEARLLQQQIDLIEKQMHAVRSHGRGPQVRSGAAAGPDALGRLRAQYIELERRARENRQHLALLEDRQFQAEMQALFTTQGKSADLVVVDPAYKPVAPVRSSRLKIILLGGAISLVLALFIGMLLALRDDRLRHPADLRRFDLPPLLCEIPPP
jgi:uncharacterized protein involved in exopolysaccharide biosynthesis